MRMIAAVLAASVLLSAPAAFGQIDPAPLQQQPTTTEPTTPAPAPTTDTTAPATPDSANATDPAHRVTCRTVENIGSRLHRSRQRICGTRDQWEQMQDQNGRDVQGMGHVQGPSG